MIKRMDFFSNRRRTVLVIGACVCVVIVSGILITSGLTKRQPTMDQDKSSAPSNGYNESTILNSFSFKLHVYPEKYAPTMSSTPGIRILPQFNGVVAEKVKYSTTYGNLLTWDITSGKISEHGQSVEFPLATPVYWSPLVSGTVKDPNEISVKVTILNKNIELAEKQVYIKHDASTFFYTVVPSNDVVIEDTAKRQITNSKTN